MREITYGKLLYRFRIERQLDRKEICEGLCSESAIILFEKENRIPDILLFERLLERMGVSPEEISLMVCEEEYQYHAWKEQVCEAIESAKTEKLKQLLCSDVCSKIYCNEKLEVQFLCYAKGILYGMNKEYENAVSLLEKATKQSMLDPSEILKKDVVLSVLEIHILMLYLYYGVKAHVLKQGDGKQFFCALEEYLYDRKDDIHKQAKCYPKLICIGMHLFTDCFKERERIQFCKRAVDMLRENNTFDDITELLRIYIPLLEKRESREVGFYQKQYEVFCDLLQGEGLNIGFQPENLNQSRPKVYLLNEYLLAKRIEKGMTQHEVSEGICEAETYSRIESGIRPPRPKKMKALAEKLEIDWCYYRGELDTCEMKALQLRSMHRRAEIEGRRYDSLDLLDDLEECLDMSSVVNYQYVSFSRCLLNCRLGKISIEETCKALEELLHLTQKMKADTSQLMYYSQTELEIIAYWAQLLRKQGKYEEGIELCEMVIKQMEHSKVGVEQQWNGFSFLIRVLSGLYFAKGEYKVAVEIAKYVKKISIQRKKGANLAEVLDEIADNLEHMGEWYSDEYKKLYRQTYYVADFFGVERIIDFAKKYYEEQFDKGMVWY